LLASRVAALVDRLDAQSHAHIHGQRTPVYLLPTPREAVGELTRGDAVTVIDRSAEAAGWLKVRREAGAGAAIEGWVRNIDIALDGA
jgi:hypothetical protein